MNSTNIILVLVLLYLVLIWKSGKIYPILYLFLFTFFLQYIFSTYFVYNEYKELRLQMPIKQEELFAYAIPALSALFLGVFIFNKDIDIRNLLRRIDPKKAIRLGYLLLIVSYVLDLTNIFQISVLTSLLSFTSYLKYLAAFCFLFSNSVRLYFLSAFVYLQLMVIVLQTGVFIDFITWGTFLVFFISLKFQLSFFIRSLLFLSAIPVIILIQSVKGEYRKATWSSEGEGGIGLFSELAQKKGKENLEGSFEKSEGAVRTIARLSQGWHLGLVLRKVPKREPFAEGEEMISDIVSSILPRFLFPEKKIVHTKEKFYKYTGHKLNKNTSMTIGILGDFYINFGRTGSFIMLFVFGALISMLVRYFFSKFVLNDPINIIWLPYFLSYLIRADNDFYIFFNCALKGFLIFLTINYLRYQYWETKLSTKLESY
jgi:hypothetical protein